MSERTYILKSRNIHFVSGKFRVLITRRPKNVYGGRFSTLKEAVECRDRLESEIAPLKPWGATQLKPVRRTQKLLRKERIDSGLCMACGLEPFEPGHKSCRSCMDILNFKRRETRNEKRV